MGFLGLFLFSELTLLAMSLISLSLSLLNLLTFSHTKHHLLITTFLVSLCTHITLSYKFSHLLLVASGV